MVKSKSILHQALGVHDAQHGPFWNDHATTLRMHQFHIAKPLIPCHLLLCIVLVVHMSLLAKNASDPLL